MPNALTNNLMDPNPGPIQLLASGMVGYEERLGNRKATGTITYGANLSAGHTVVINGVTFTAVSSDATGPQFNVAGSLTATLDAIVTVLNASEDASVAVATYANSGGTALSVVFDKTGAAGNDFTLAATGSGTASAATLTGGAGDHPISGKAETVGLVTTDGGNMDFKLPDGADGQERTLFFKTKGSGANAIVTGTFGGGTTATFDAANDLLKVKWIGAAWRTLVATSVTIS